MEDLISQLQLHARGIWKYRWVAIGVAWLVALVGWVAVFATPNVFQSTARVYVDTQSMLKPLLAGMTSMPNVEQQVAIMSRTLISRPNVERVMRMTDLDVNATSARQQELAVEQLMENIKITGTNAHNIYSISYRHDDPQLVRNVVQSLLTIFVEGSFKGKRSDAEQALQFIDAQITTYEAKLIAAETALKEFKLLNNALLPRAGGDHASRLAAAADSLQTAELELAEAEQAREALQAEISGEPPRRNAGGQSRRTRFPNPELDARLGEAYKQLDTLMLLYTDRHPDIIAARRLVAQLEERKAGDGRGGARGRDPGAHYSPMLQQLKVALTEADARVAAIGVRVAGYHARHARLQQHSKAVLEVEAELAQLNRDYEINKDSYARLVNRREAARLSGDLSATTDMMSFKIIDPPTLPAVPVGPNRVMLASLVLFGALCTGAAAALMISQARPGFAGPGALSALTGLNVLGSVAVHWTAAQERRHRRSNVLLALLFGGLLLLFAALLTVSLLTR